MSLPVPGLDDICHGISAYSVTDGLITRLDMLNDYLLFWQDAAEADPERRLHVPVGNFRLMVEDIFAQACQLQRLLKPFTAHMR